MRRSKLVAPVMVLILTVSAIAAVWLLVGRASASRQAQLQVSAMKLSLADLQSAPFDADRAFGGTASAARIRIQADEGLIARGLTGRSQPGVPAGPLIAGRSKFGGVESVVRMVFLTATRTGGLQGAGSRGASLPGLMQARSASLSGVLEQVSRTDAARAAAARTQTKLGAAGAMLLLLTAFSWFYFRSVAARDAVERLAREKSKEARTDALTNLGNRRALTNDLASAVADPRGSELLLVMFDLDGFKQYNDTFGHAAGDSLLQRLGGRLAAAAKTHGACAYRMGGDEFCLLARCGPETTARLVGEAVAALQASGEGWHVGCSHGVAWMPSQAATESDALKVADERMYAEKAGRSSAGRQVTDALLQVITEQDARLDDHVERVAELAGALAVALGEPALEVRRIRVAAQLHDVGKTAIPAAILDKPGPLDELEWEFMRRHPVIGERIVLAAPALANAAALIRSSHEQVDGHGYPDGLSGEHIPLGSRIIFVCDAFDAMTSDRRYRPAITADAALAELTRRSGTQFDTTVVDAFCDEITLRENARHERLVSTASG